MSRLLSRTHIKKTLTAEAVDTIARSALHIALLFGGWPNVHLDKWVELAYEGDKRAQNHLSAEQRAQLQSPLIIPGRSVNHCYFQYATHLEDHLNINRKTLEKVAVTSET
jgi:hypothetical protein